MIVLNLSSGNAKWAYNADILKGKSIAFATAWNAISGFFVGLLFPIGEEGLGIYSMFFIFAILLAISMIYCYPYIIETKGLNRNEIEEEYEVMDEMKSKGKKYIAKSKREKE